MICTRKMEGKISEKKSCKFLESCNLLQGISPRSKKFVKKTQFSHIFILSRNFGFILLQ